MANSPTLRYLKHKNTLPRESDYETKTARVLREQKSTEERDI